MITSDEWNKLSSNTKFIIEKYQHEVPIKLGALAKELGITVKKATLPANISGEIREVDGSIVIRINRHDVKARQRFTLAHEISHFLLHKDMLKEGIVDDVLYRSTQSNVVEAQANRLAADILMPPELTKNLITKHSIQKDKELIYESVAEELGVSTTALKIRIDKI